MDVMDAIVRRRSVRRFDGREVEMEKLQCILEAGRLAPSARNEQLWRIFAVTDRDLIRSMESAYCGQTFVKDAPALLGVCTTGDRIMVNGVSARIVDASIAMSFMVLEAEELGLGTCWLGKYDEPAVRSALGIPDSYTLVALACLGYEDGKTPPKPRKAPQEVFFLNRYRP